MLEPFVIQNLKIKVKTWGFYSTELYTWQVYIMFPRSSEHDLWLTCTRSSLFCMVCLSPVRSPHMPSLSLLTFSQSTAAWYDSWYDTWLLTCSSDLWMSPYNHQMLVTSHTIQTQMYWTHLKYITSETDMIPIISHRFIIPNVQSPPCWFSKFFIEMKEPKP